jgi:ATP-binding cassette subfamily G (WHITE) protein 2 (PDR)
MLEVISHGSNDQGEDWHEVWKKSTLRSKMDEDIDSIHQQKQHEKVAGADEKDGSKEFAVPFMSQLVEVTYRVFQQYWRMPSYIFAKFGLALCAGLFVGFTFYRAKTSQSGMQNVLFAAFMITTIFTTIVQQVSGYSS